MAQSTLLQLVRVYFQWFDACGGLCGLFHVGDGLHTSGHIRLTILKTNSQKGTSNFIKKPPLIKLTTPRFFNDVIDPKLGTTPETEKVGNGSPGQSGLMYPGWHASAAGTISESRDLSVQIFGVTSALFLLVTRLKMGSPA